MTTGKMLSDLLADLTANIASYFLGEPDYMRLKQSKLQKKTERF